jgi:hypothetical protein
MNEYATSNSKTAVPILLLLIVVSLQSSGNAGISPAGSLSETPSADQWQEDFKYQAVSRRPSLEVNYADASRTAFQILAQAYQLTGQLAKPHLLSDTETGEPWLWLEIVDEAGAMYSTLFFKGKSRINLYRRGPYFCELHWFDIGLATEDGQVAPLKGDLALFCYPEKILAEITWHGTGGFLANALHVKGIQNKVMACHPFKDKTK